MQPYTDKLHEELEKVQNRAARFVTRNYVYETGSMTGILGQLKWESLKKRRKDNRLILLYKGLKGKARKIMTRILVNRLEAHLEGNNIMDAEQDGFRKKHSTIHAVLRLVQSIYNGFERDEATAVIFIDLKGAYDTIWREGLVYKLHKSGVQDKLLGWINNFLQNRSVRARCPRPNNWTYLYNINWIATRQRPLTDPVQHLHH